MGQKLHENLMILVRELAKGSSNKIAQKIAVIKLAKMAGVNTHTLDSCLQGNAPDLEFLSMIGKNLNINLNWLINGIGQRHMNADSAGQLKSRQG